MIGVPDAERGEIVKALVVPTAGRGLSVSALEAHCLSTWASTSGPARSKSSTSCPRTSWARSSAAACGRPISRVSRTEPVRRPGPQAELDAASQKASTLPFCLNRYNQSSEREGISIATCRPPIFPGEVACSTSPLSRESGLPLPRRLGRWLRRPAHELGRTVTVAVLRARRRRARADRPGCFRHRCGIRRRRQHRPGHRLAIAGSPRTGSPTPCSATALRAWKRSPRRRRFFSWEKPRRSWPAAPSR